jgi:hypothetical protein
LNGLQTLDSIMSEKRSTKRLSKTHSDIHGMLHFGIIRFMFEAGNYRYVTAPLKTAGATTIPPRFISIPA